MIDGDTARGINAYVVERNKALAGPFEGFEDWCRTVGKWHNNPVTRLAAYHKLRTAAVSLPMELRSESKRWLLEHNYQPLDDGDVPT